MGKLEGRRPLGRYRIKWEDIKIDVRVIECIDLAQDRDQQRTLVNMAMNFRVPLNVGELLNVRATGDSVPWSWLVGWLVR